MTGIIIEHTQIEYANPPEDIASAGVTGERVSLARFSRGGMQISQGAWAATGGGAAITLQQHDALSGGNSKSLGIKRYYQKVGIGSSQQEWAEVAVVNDTFDLPDVANTMTYIEVEAAELDTTGGFYVFSLDIGDPGIGASLVHILALLSGGRYGGDPGTQVRSAKVT